VWQLWSFGLTGVGLLAMFLAGRKLKSGWALGFVAQAAWMTYGIVSHQYGFCVSSIAYAAIYGRNWALWTAHERKEKAPAAA
jgi:uncharacterized membrane protein YjjB (DUF3815 family)